MNVHILVTCRNQELKDMSELVFKTAKVGFPTYNIHVVKNDDLQFTHGQFIYDLIMGYDQPFWICDTDIVFFNSMEDIKSLHSITGRYEPAFREPWCKCVKPERIHTCLMLVNPVTLREEFEAWSRKCDRDLFVQFGFELSLKSCVRGKMIPPNILYDTCSQLYTVVSTKHFTDEQNSRFEHLHCGSYSDRVKETYPTMQKSHQMSVENPSSIKGLQHIQNNFYKEHAI